MECEIEQITVKCWLDFSGDNVVGEAGGVRDDEVALIPRRVVAYVLRDQSRDVV